MVFVTKEERMVIARARDWLRYTILVCFVFFLNIEGLEGVEITIIESAVAKGAVCLDGSPPAYQLDKGFGDGVNSWLVFMQGGGWCHSVDDCVYRKTMSSGLGSSKLMSEMNFTGILSNKQELNPYFYNWNRVIMRYCDGSSFTGDVEQVDPANNLYFRGSKVFNVIVEELMAHGMNNAQNAILSGSSAGGLASILNCDKFSGFFSSNTRVKCVSDGGYFAHAKDLSGEYHFEKYYDQVVTLHGSVLPSGCTSKMSPSLCFYPQYAMPHISTPIFILNSAYDTWQVYYILASYEADPNGDFNNCKMDLSQCSTTQLKRFEDFRSDFLGSVSSGGHGSSKGMFINTCYIHTQSETQSAWFGNPTSKIDNMSMAEGIGEWFYDKSVFQKIDSENVLPHYC